jgi:hypothetical protein
VNWRLETDQSSGVVSGEESPGTFEQREKQALVGVEETPWVRMAVKVWLNRWMAVVAGVRRIPWEWFATVAALTIKYR